MKKFTQIIFTLICLLSTIVFANTGKTNFSANKNSGEVCFEKVKKDITNTSQIQDEKWNRVQSDNGEFSIEIPPNYNYFYDKDGFWGSYKSDSFILKEMSLLNSLYKDTLLSFEVYKTEKNALNMMLQHYKRRKQDVEKIERNEYEIYQVVNKTDKFYSVRQYFRSKDFLYILTAASKNGETASIKRFLNSLNFNPKNNETPDLKVTFYSKLKVSPIKLETITDTQKKLDIKNRDRGNPNSVDDLVVVNKDTPGYTNSARMRNVQGRVELLIEFSSDGFVSNISILESLPEGLLRQAVFAAVRIKFLPKEINGNPQTTSKVVFYNFSIY